MRASQLFLFTLVAAGSAAASVIHVTGYLNDPADPRLIGPGVNGADAVFDPLDPGASINNVVLLTFSLPNPRNVRFAAPGADQMLIDPYLSVFRGPGHGATFLFSAMTAAFGDPIDVSQPLVAGDYAVALSAFLNMSFAENLGSGTLGDGFIGLGNSAGGIAYALRIDTGTASIPEPSLLGLVASGLLLLAVKRRFGDFKGGL